MKIKLISILFFIFSTALFSQINYKDYLESAIAKLELEDYKGAMQDYNKAIEINPKLALDSFKSSGLSISSLEKLLETNPKNAFAYFMIGHIKSEIGDDEIEIIQDFSKGLDINPKFADAYYYGGEAKL